jgi:hypothetical protein
VTKALFQNQFLKILGPIIPIGSQSLILFPSAFYLIFVDVAVLPAPALVDRFCNASAAECAPAYLPKNISSKEGRLVGRSL